MVSRRLLTIRTILNMHELAVASGFSAAYRLGAKYPFSEVEGCGRLFKLYLAASHGMRAVCAACAAPANVRERRIEVVFSPSEEQVVVREYSSDILSYNTLNYKPMIRCCATLLEYGK